MAAAAADARPRAADARRPRDPDALDQACAQVHRPLAPDGDCSAALS